MYQQHPCFTTPDKNTRLRRYVDLGRFVSLLERRALWFACPGTFDDPWEGCYPKLHYEPDFIAVSMRALGVPEEHVNDLVRVEMQSRGMDLHYRDWHAVNCWHMGEAESDALWKLYAEHAGIAIVTDVGRLTEALSTFTEAVYIGALSYLDPDCGTLPTNNVFWPLVWKRHAFSHEREVRAVVSMGPDVFETIRENACGIPATKRLDPLPKGRYVPANLDALVESVSVHPLAPAWMLEVVEGVTRRYGLDCKIAQSDLAEPPPISIRKKP